MYDFKAKACDKQQKSLGSCFLEAEDMFDRGKLNLVKTCGFDWAASQPAIYYPYYIIKM